MITVQPTVVVGLGEVGRRSVAYLKRRIYEIYEGPLESVMLLAITMRDDDNTDARRTAALPFDLLPREDVALSLRDAHHAAPLLSQKFPWLPAGVVGSDGTDPDARAAARLAFMNEMTEILAPFLQENLNRLFSAPAHDAMKKKGLDINPNAAVYVVAALDDPVGSGLFLDAVYLIREILRRQNVGSQTTGIFFLPESRALNETRGANVYAALKELDFHMSGNKFAQKYTTTLSVDDVLPPFSHGCFLVDTMNERQVALGERDEASAMLGEWLFQAALTPCKPHLDGAINAASGQAQNVQRRMAAYGSLGLAGFILPIEPFIDWCANKLADELIGDYVRGVVSKSQILQDVGTFENNHSLTPDSLKANVLNAPGLGNVAATTISTLEVTPWAALEDRARGEARQLEKSALPAYTRQINTQQMAHRDTFGRELKNQQRLLLNHATVANQIPLAMNFFNELKNKLERYRGGQETEMDTARNRIVARGKETNKTGAALFRALSSIPRSALDFVLIGLGFLVAFLVPLILVGRLIWSVVVPNNAAIGYLLLLLLVGGALGILGFIGWQVRSRILQARSDFLSSFRNYIDALVDYANTKEALAFYPEAIQATQARYDELSSLLERLTAIRNDCARASANTETLVGAIDFPLQRSLLTEAFIRSEYSKHAGNLEERYRSLLTNVGTPATWLAQTAADLGQRFLNFGRDVFRPLRNNTVIHLLEMDPNDSIRKQTVQDSAKELLLKSAPMWSYNQYSLGQDQSGTGSLASYELLALEDPTLTQLDNEYQGISPKLKTATTHDPYRLQIIRLRQGFPLFGLRAFNDFRKHYETTLQESARPPHIDDTYLRAQDPLPYPTTIELHSTIDTLFAVGCVAGVVTDHGGRYVVHLSERKAVPLAATPERSVALLGLKPELAAALDERIVAWSQQHEREEAVGLLQAAIDAGDRQAWEATAMQEFIRQLES